MKKSLLLLTLLVLGTTFASAQTFGFGTAIGGSGLYCNYEVLVNYGGGLWAGIDNLSPCGSTFATISGFGATVPAGGPSAFGKGVVYGDSIYAAYFGLTEAQWTVFTKLKCNKVKGGLFQGKNGWEGVAGFSGLFGGTNAGPLSCTHPGKNGVMATKGASVKQKN